MKKYSKIKSEYAKSVDYTKAEVFRREMQAMSKRTLAFPNKRGVFVDKETVGAHGAPGDGAPGGSAGPVVGGYLTAFASTP